MRVKDVEPFRADQTAQLIACREESKEIAPDAWGGMRGNTVPQKAVGDRAALGKEDNGVPAPHQSARKRFDVGFRATRVHAVRHQQNPQVCILRFFVVFPEILIHTDPNPVLRDCPKSFSEIPYAKNE